MKISICQIQAYYIPTYLDFSHADLEYADFSQSKKTHKPRTCCTQIFKRSNLLKSLNSYISVLHDFDVEKSVSNSQNLLVGSTAVLLETLF